MNIVRRLSGTPQCDMTVRGVLGEGGMLLHGEVGVSLKEKHILGLAAIILAGFVRGDATQAVSLPTPVGAAVALAFGAAMIASMQAHYGFENATFIAEEVRDPRRNLPLALGFGMAVVIVLYLLVNLSLFRALPYDVLASSESPTALAMERTLGIAGGKLLAAVVVISTFGSLNGAVLASPRLFYAMGKAGLFFEFTTRVHPKYKTPHLSIIALTVVALAYVVGLGTWQRVTEAVSVAFVAFLSLAVIAGKTFEIRTRPAARETRLDRLR